MPWNKFRAKKSVSKDGKHFPSKLECAVYEMLRVREKCGEISEIKLQDTVHFSGTYLKWKVDFSFETKEQKVWCEAKGVETEGYRKNKTLWKTHGPGKLEIWKGNSRGVFLSETIIPQSKKE